MTYQNNIPRPTDQLNNSQLDIQTNFLEIYNWVAINHFEFDTPNAGKHTIVTLPVNTAPTPTLDNEVSIYSRLSTVTDSVEFTLQNESNGSIFEWSAAEYATPGWTMLPSGILVKWGFETQTGFNQLISLPAGLPRFRSVFAILTSAASSIASTNQVTYITNSINLVPDPQTFNVNCYSLTGASATTAFYYAVIGEVVPY